MIPSTFSARIGLALLASVWLLFPSVASAGQINWVGPAKFFLAEGNDYDVVPPLGNPLFTVNPPANANRVFANYPGLTFSLSLTRSGPRNLRLRAGVIPAIESRVISPAGTTPTLVEHYRRIVIQADYQVSQVNGAPNTMLVETAGGVGATGSQTNTFGQIDESESEASITLSETSNLANASLLSDYALRSFHMLDGVTLPTPDPVDFSGLHVLDRENGLFTLQIVVDLRARVFGSQSEERASATWNQMVDLKFSLFDFSGVTVPEPTTWALLLSGAVPLAWHLRQRRRLPPG